MSCGVGSYVDEIFHRQEMCNNCSGRRVFSKCTKTEVMPILSSEALLCENEKFQQQNVTPVSIEPRPLMNV